MTATAPHNAAAGGCDVSRLGYAAKIDAAAGKAGGADPSRSAKPTSQIVAAGRDHAPRCSFAQEQFWFVDQLTPGNAAFTFSWPVRLRGRLNTGALERALAELVRRHESLRTRFSVENGQPVQVVDPPDAFDLDIVDVSGENDPQQAAQRLIDDETRQPFDLSRGGLLRARLLRLSETEHVIQIVVHHIVFDEWSKVVLFRELSTLYEAFVEDRPSPLPEPGVQYADFADWQRSWLTDEVLQEELAHWTKELAGIPTALELPADRQRPAVASLRGSRRRLPLPRALTEELEELTRREGTTFFAGLLALFDVLLHRFTGEDDIVVGIPVDNRSQREIEDTIGVFLNTVVIRNDLSGAPSFRGLLGRVHTRLLDAAQHADMPFERLVRELRPVRDLSRHPIFQALLAINPPEPSLQLPGIETEEIETAVTAAKVDLFLFVQEQAHGFDALWEYNTDLFEDETIERIHTHFLCLLEAVVADPDRSIDELPILPEEERRRMLVDWNSTDVEYPLASLHELVEAQVERSPNAVAVVCGHERLTYTELNARANQLARRLRTVGVGPDSLVALSLDRSFELVVALLGILKAGGAFVPLDPELPQERLAFMLEDSKAGVLLTQKHLLVGLSRYAGMIIDLDSDWLDIAREDNTDLRANVGADNLAYVIYTSGSTGRPKGVLNTHRGIVNRLLAMQASYRLDGSDSLLQKTPSSFDVAVREAFWPLLNGARLVVAAPGGHKDPLYLAGLIEREQVTTLHFVPSMLQLFLEQVDSARCQSLRCVMSGGESLSVDLARRFFDRFDIELHNFYGPTEAAVSVTAWRCDPTFDGPIVPIGFPVANTQIHVLDPRLELVPVGVWGELFIGGAQVARGYHDRPDLTAERFVPNPFGPGRLYRTGDLGRWNSEGALEFGGRIDNQVKLRGFRVELGEIEAVLCEHDAVAESVVLMTEPEAGQPELAAYVVLNADQQSPELVRPALHEFLKTRLPDYMVPASVTPLEELPLSPNGKLDRGALPRPERPQTKDEFAAPATATEQAIAEIWRELLGVDLVGRNDDFFALGGHSLLAARLLGRVCTRLDVELPLRAFFEGPTVAALAAKMDAALEQEVEPQLPPLVAMTGLRECSFAQERFWFVDQIMGRSAAYTIPVPLRVRGDLQIAHLERTLSEIMRRHEILRTHFSIEDGRPMQVVEPARPVSLSTVDLVGQPEDERMRTAQRLVDEQTQLPFDLARGPLVRMQLLRLDKRDHILHLTFDHLVFDGWSKVVLLRELRVLYDAFARGEASPLQELGVQYGDFADWQRSWLQGELLDRELAYWKDALEGMPAALELPTDRPRPAVSSMRGAWSRSTVPAQSLERLQALGHRQGATLYMALLAVFDILLYRYTGQDDVVLGMPVDGRGRPEIDDSIGDFVDTVILRVDLSGGVTFRQLLDRVRDRTLDAVAHRRLPFDRLVRELQPDRELGRHPLYQVMLTLVPAEPPLELADLEIEEITTERTSAPIDLTVFLEQRENGLEAIWEYSTDLFERETIERMQAHFLQLLQAAAADPDRPIDALPMLAEAERQDLLDVFSREAADYPVACLHELFETQAERCPEAVAVTSEDGALTYRELNERANQLAHQLRATGVGPDSLVALCLERSLEIVVAILAVLKAGGGYVPLDPAYPVDRLAFVLADTGARIVITQERMLDRLPPTDARVLCLDLSDGDRRTFGIHNPERLATPDDLAYVIYTSGSTGQPKGVAITHRNVARLFSATHHWFGFGDNDTWLLFHSYAFDFSVWEMWGALLYGGRLVITPQWTTRSPHALAALVVEQGVTVFNTTPSVFVAAMDELLQVATKLSLRLVIFGGEALHLPSLRPWFASVGADSTQLVNMYGITETTVHVTYRPLRVEDAEQSAGLIGRPIPDLQVYLLDANLEPVPAGVPGEIYVGGAGIARGYLNREELTAERFPPNPFGPGRLYRSGDRARLRSDGELEYLGRADDQVKIRGFRIELGEIKAALGEHEGVVDAVVIPFEVGPGDARLAAYVVLDPIVLGVADASERVEKELWTLLERRLPSFMVPSAIVVLESLPLTPNGKLDVRSLPLPTLDGRSDSSFLAPQTGLEKEIAAIWCEILSLERAGLNDNFFHLGGHSLLAARVVTQVRKRFEADLPVRALFEHPTLAAFAARVAAAGAEVGEGAPTDKDGADDTPREPAYPLSFLQQELFFLDELTPGIATHNAGLAIRAVGSLDRAALEGAVADVIQRHEALRTVLIRGAESATQVVLDQWKFELAVVDLAPLPADDRDAELQRQLQERTRQPFDLSRDLMLRATLFTLDATEHVVLFAVHHIASDGWSVRVFCHDLAEFYEARRANRPPRLPELPLQYRDFALWQRERLRGERLEQEIAYWRTQLAGAPTILRLPTDRLRPPRRTFESAKHEVVMPQQVAEDVLRLCRENDATPYMLLLSVFGLLLYRLTGQDDILVSGPFANRGRGEFEHLIGFFANTLVMRVRLAGNPPFTTLLARTRETALEALDHQEVPLQRVVEAVRPQRNPGVNPLTQVNFRVRVDPRATLELTGAATSTLPVDVGFAHFDLALELNVLNDGIVGEFIYNIDLFEHASIERLATDFDALLRQILNQQDVRLLSLELPSERQKSSGSASIRGAAIRPLRGAGSEEALDVRGGLDDEPLPASLAGRHLAADDATAHDTKSSTETRGEGAQT